MEREYLSVENYIHLSDLALVSTLRVLGIKETAVDRSNSSKIQFVFEKTKSVEEIIKKYYSGELVVEPQAFFLHLKAVKGRIYSQEI